MQVARCVWGQALCVHGGGTLSSKVNLPHVINFGALCGANLVTYPVDSRVVEFLELHRVSGVSPDTPARSLDALSVHAEIWGYNPV